MKRPLLALACVLLPACALFRPYPKPAWAPASEAAQVQFPRFDPPEKGRRTLEGPMLRAIQLALDDFLPWDVQPHAGATAREQCLYRRDSFDTTAAPGPDGVMFVRFTVRDGVCDAHGPPILDMGATYAVDTRLWRILAVQR
ncbi:hypothetical protein KRR26_17090 [Corallococcus sp. M34]|uniref:hypothetical protein n=1 Tax=Citreicoccus inhibens TaxID=2849499 RepID=UPI001C24A6CD|nr:hypothetical protein [Citreicoccus inhibens]MBU8897334.1 hypothetical protein [Citreicoccus inhibens]